ncbi:MAG TPA: hypothetical protein DEV68_05935 [Corynebacterium flavescens]|nr:hypothetical protein [Corynebacterium flavescens]
MGRDGQNDHPFWGRPAGDDRYQPQDPHDVADDHRRGPSQRSLPVKVASIPFHGTDVQSVEVDGEPYVVFRPLVETLGLGYGSQTQKLTGKSWASVTKIVTVGADGRNREMTVINLKTLTMWLATLDENRVNETSRPLVIAYQNEVAEAIEAYWTKGGAINPRVSDTREGFLAWCRQRRTGRIPIFHRLGDLTPCSLSTFCQCFTISLNRSISSASWSYFFASFLACFHIWRCSLSCSVSPLPSTGAMGGYPDGGL